MLGRTRLADLLVESAAIQFDLTKGTLEEQIAEPPGLSEDDPEAPRQGVRSSLRLGSNSREKFDDPGLPWYHACNDGPPGGLRAA